MASFGVAVSEKNRIFCFNQEKQLRCYIIVGRSTSGLLIEKHCQEVLRKLCLLVHENKPAVDGKEVKKSKMANICLLELKQNMALFKKVYKNSSLK